MIKYRIFPNTKKVEKKEALRLRLLASLLTVPSKKKTTLSIGHLLPRVRG